ncbi:MAG: hypothetical protein JNJ50_29610 [Acidobacteria bacterium]|jgi:hypothetical protein|nr:hypothetical protein [Acidobacteriota bacterium]
MDYTVKAAIAIGVLLILGLIWAVWKFAFRLVKHVIFALILGGVFAGTYWYRMRAPGPDPAIGKHAYLKENGRYLGVVEGQGEDSRRGEVWSIRLPGGYPKMYGKVRVVLKDQRDLASEPTPEPEPTATPTAAPKAKTAKPAAASAGAKKG